MHTLVQSPTPVNRIRPSSPDAAARRFQAIVRAADRIAARHPHLYHMSRRAGEIVEHRQIAWRDPHTVVVQSAAGNGAHEIYIVGSTILECTCPSFQFRPAVINGHPYCKHIMALAIAHRIGDSIPGEVRS